MGIVSGIENLGKSAWNAVTGQSPVPQTGINKSAISGYGQYDPATNTIYDPTQGTVYQVPPGYRYDPTSGGFVGPDGQHHDLSYVAGTGGQVTNPSVVQQVASNWNTRQQLLTQSGGFGASLNNAIGGQNNLIQDYQNTLTNPNAPSVARTQLQQGLNASQAQQLSLASGVSGANAGLARTTAAGNMAKLATQEQNDAAIAREQEMQQARTGIANALSSVAGESLQGYGTALNAAAGFGSEAGNLQAGKENIATQTQQKNASNEQSFVVPVANGTGSSLTRAGTT